MVAADNDPPWVGWLTHNPHFLSMVNCETNVQVNGFTYPEQTITASKKEAPVADVAPKTTIGRQGISMRR
jgi:hypothetical protein